MKHLIKIMFASLMFLTLLNAGDLEDRAFNAYKNRDYKQAVELYKEAAKNNSLKAILMLGLFSEEGIGVIQDTDRAIKFYKFILKRTSNIKKLISSSDKDKKLSVTISALTRLYNLTDNQRYMDIAQKLKKIKDKKNQPMIIIEGNNLFDQNSTSSIDDFLILCPQAQKVAPEDREGIEDFDCALFENFSDRMVLFMKLRRLKFKALKSPKKMAEILKKLNIKIAYTINPMIKYLQQDTINCYNKAKTNMDIKSCDYDYLAKTDPLLFDHAALRMERAMSNSNERTVELGAFEKEDIVNSLIERINSGTYGKPYRNMVK